MIKNIKKIIYLLLISCIYLASVPSLVNAQISLKPTYYLYESDDDASEIFEGVVTDAALSCAKDAFINGLIGKAGDAISGVLGFDAGALLSGDFGSLFDSGLGGILGGLGGFATVPVDAAKLNSITSKIKGDTGAQVAKEIGAGGSSLDSIAYCMANKTLQGIVGATARWVNGGFNGNSIFVNNPSRYFGNISDFELERFLDALTEDLICVNIRVDLGDIKRSLLVDYDAQIRIPECLLGEIDIVVDANGNIIEGNGWDAWFAYTTDPYSNYYGARQKLSSRLNQEIAEKQTISKIELDWNNGYQSIRNDETGDITKPGNLIQAQVAKTVTVPIERLTFADEFDEMLNGLINGYMKQFVGGVIGG